MAGLKVSREAPDGLIILSALERSKSAADIAAVLIFSISMGNISEC